jgi:hypothetical protein
MFGECRVKIITPESLGRDILEGRKREYLYQEGA